MKKNLVILAVFILLALPLFGCERQCEHKNAVVDAAVAATCTETGLTEGKHCADCGEVLSEQMVTPAADHDYKEYITFDDDGTAVSMTVTCEKCGFEDAKQFCTDLALEFNDGVKTCTVTGMGECTHTEVNIPPAGDVPPFERSIHSPSLLCDRCPFHH